MKKVVTFLKKQLIEERQIQSIIRNKCSLGVFLSTYFRLLKVYCQAYCEEKYIINKAIISKYTVLTKRGLTRNQKLRYEENRLWLTLFSTKGGGILLKCHSFD